MGDRTVGPPMAPLALLALAATLTAAAIPLSRSAQETQADLAPMSLVGWTVGVGGVLLFMWFRTADISASADRQYVIPRWNPRRVAVGLAMTCWLLSALHAYVIADAVARR